jgi:hypothetical protein
MRLSGGKCGAYADDANAAATMATLRDGLVSMRGCSEASPNSSPAAKVHISSGNDPYHVQNTGPRMVPLRASAACNAHCSHAGS